MREEKPPPSWYDPQIKASAKIAVATVKETWRDMAAQYQASHAQRAESKEIFQSYPEGKPLVIEAFKSYERAKAAHLRGLKSCRRAEQSLLAWCEDERPRPSRMLNGMTERLDLLKIGKNLSDTGNAMQEAQDEIGKAEKNFTKLAQQIIAAQAVLPEDEDSEQQKKLREVLDTAQIFRRSMQLIEGNYGAALVLTDLLVKPFLSLVQAENFRERPGASR